LDGVHDKPQSVNRLMQIFPLLRLGENIVELKASQEVDGTSKKL